MVKGPLLLDTNVLIYALNGTRKSVRRILDARNDHAISLITWMEVMVGHPEARELETVSFLAGFQILDLDRDIAKQAVDLRRNYKVKLPDAIILATANLHKRTLVTYNSKDFAGVRGVYIPT